MNAPRLPEKPVKLALISGEYPELALRLRQQGITPVETLFDPRLPKPVAYHPDMQACFLGAGCTYVLRDNPLRDQLSELGMPAMETEKAPGNTYPKDALCNAFPWTGWLVGNPCTMDPAIHKAAISQGLELLPVRQGYAACAVALLDGQAAITADPGIAYQLEKTGFTVARIRPGSIKLPGYDTGFLGGCCGKLAPDLLAVTGRLDSHPDGNTIRDFIESRGISIWELTDKPLLDVGGIIPLG